jgi:hypothetical protein
MPRYAVTVRMIVTKTYTVEAEDECHATEIAHEIATPAYEDGMDEDFNQETVLTEKLEEQ